MNEVNQILHMREVHQNHKKIYGLADMKEVIIDPHSTRQQFSVCVFKNSEDVHTSWKRQSIKKEEPCRSWLIKERDP